jgi:hypothetical protein
MGSWVGESHVSLPGMSHCWPLCLCWQILDGGGGFGSPMAILTRVLMDFFSLAILMAFL